MCPHWGVLMVSVKAGAWSGCSSCGTAFFLVNFCMKWLLWNLQVRFNCAGSRKVCAPVLGRGIRLSVKSCFFVRPVLFCLPYCSSEAFDVFHSLALTKHSMHQRRGCLRHPRQGSLSCRVVFFPCCLVLFSIAIALLLRSVRCIRGGVPVVARVVVCCVLSVLSCFVFHSLLFRSIRRFP